MMICRELFFSLSFKHPFDDAPYCLLNIRSISSLHFVHEGPAVGTAHCCRREYFLHQALHVAPRQPVARALRRVAGHRCRHRFPHVPVTGLHRAPIRENPPAGPRRRHPRATSGTALIFIELSEKSSMSNPISENVSIFSMYQRVIINGKLDDPRKRETLAFRDASLFHQGVVYDTLVRGVKIDEVEGIAPFRVRCRCRRPRR